MCNTNGLVFGVFTSTLTHFLFQRVWVVYIILMEIPEGWEGVIFVVGGLT